MDTFLIILAIILVIAIVAMIILYIAGKKIEKKNAANKEAIESSAQWTSILVIDKKKIKMKEANLPKIVYEQTPKYLRRSKVPIVKAKIGPKTMSLMCAPEIFDLVPVKATIKAKLSGIYISDVKGKLLPKPEKKKLRQRLKAKITGK